MMETNGVGAVTIRKLLVPFAPSEGGRQALQTAFAVARTFAAHVEVLHVRPDPQEAVPLLGEGVSGAMVEELINLTEREAAARAAEASRLFEELRSGAGFPLADKPTLEGPTTRWVERTGREEDVTVEHGHLCDLIVVGRAASEADATAAATLRAVLFESGRPVMLAPTPPPPRCGERLAVAWNDSAEAARGVAGALPFLKHAQSVFVFTATSEKTLAASANRLVDFLGWHGVTAEIGHLPEGRASVGEALLDAASAVEANLLVMGAYTHSRLRQLILGGVTHHVLEHAKIPMLMAH